MSKAEPKNTDKTKYVVLAPLSDFYWGGTEFSTTESMQIKEYKELPDLDRYKFVLSKADWSELNKVSHWIYFEQCGSEILSPAEKINAFLFALWVVRPTPAHVKYRFKFPHGVGTNQSGCFSRLLDRFQPISKQVSHDSITDDDLGEVARLMTPIESLYKAKKRLRNAIVLNFRGCMQIGWQVAFVCFSAAAEAILTYSRKPRLTKRLAKSYACLVESTKPERDSAYQTFKRLYGVRSDIMHGRAMHLNIPDVNLEYLAEFSDLLRNLWKVVLNSTDLINVLESGDAERKKWFLNNEDRYVPTDYVIARGTVVLGSGSYLKEKGRWRFPPGRHLPLKAAIADIDFFFRTVESVHPQPLAFVSPEEYLQLKRQSKAGFKAAANDKGNVPKSVLAVTVAEAAAFFKDGHTYCHLGPGLLDGTDPTKRMLPFRLEYRHGDIVISDTTEELESLKGRKLLKINDVHFAEFIGPILDKLSGERMAFRIRGFMHKQRVYWAIIPLTKDPEVSITVLDGKGRSERLTVELLSLREYDIGVPKTQRGKKESYHELHHGGKTCYWQYNSFVYSEREKRNVDCLFALLKEKEVENLIIDLRFNSGGNSSAGDYILNYLTAKPYGQFSKFDVKLSDQVLEKGRETRLGELAGLTVTRRLALREPEEKGFRFDGRLFLLTGPDTFSSAASFAAAVKDYEIGTIIGEETGGLRQCFGDQVRFRLPNSGISFGVSYKRFYAPIPKPDDDIRGVVPDIDIDEEMLSEFSNVEDPLLTFALDYVQRN